MAFSVSVSCPPVVLFCDFGLPYTGQMKGRMAAEWRGDAPVPQVIDLFHDVPAHDIQAGSVLLAAHAGDFPPGSVFVCVVDPGVGSDQRKPGALHVDGRWFVGPLNGVFEHLLRWRGGGDVKAYEIVWRPEHLAPSFHGRDLFAPIAARLAQAGGDVVEGLSPLDVDGLRHADFAEDPEQIIYADGFGNLMTGVRWSTLGAGRTLSVGGRKLPRARTFSDVEKGQVFVYQNGVGLCEISANLGNAQKKLEITPGTRVKLVSE